MVIMSSEEKAKEKEIRTQKLLSSIHNMTHDNSKRIYFRTSKIKTTDIFNNLGYENKQYEFLVIDESNIVVLTCGNYVYLSLVVKRYNDVNVVYGGFSISQLKTNFKNMHEIVLEKRYVKAYAISEFSKLYKHILELPLDDCSVNDKIPFCIPLDVTAQIPSDRAGFGKEYHRDTLVWEREYGDTSANFAFIGVVVNNII